MRSGSGYTGNRDSNPNNATNHVQQCWPCTTVVSFFTLLKPLGSRKLAKWDEKKTCTKYATTLFTLRQTKLSGCSCGGYLSLLPHNTPNPLELPVHTVIASSFGLLLPIILVDTDTDMCNAARAIWKVTSIFVTVWQRRV